jgi:ribosome recycling factor
LREKLEKCFEFYSSQVRCIHGTHLNSGFIDTIRVPYQGQKVPIRDIGWATDRDRVIVIQLYDKESVGVTLQAIKEAGLSAYTAKTEVIVSIPRPTTEDIERNQKRVRVLAEDAKVAVRKVRQEFRDRVKKLPEDERKRLEKEIQMEIDKEISRIDHDSRAKIEALGF